MENKQTIEIRVDDAIALCHILDEFDKFNENFTRFLEGTKDNYDLISKLGDFSKGRTSIVSKKIKDFYNDNKFVIDTINKYSGIFIFIAQNYSILSEEISINEKSYLFYQYILENRDKFDNIIEVLYKIKQLGFTLFSFNATLDFSNKTYTAHRELYVNKGLGGLTYLDNLESIPNYGNEIKYKTNGSNYLIKIGGISIGKISPFGNQITLNSLTFDANRLPKELTKEEIFHKILASSQKKQQEYNIIRNSVDLSVGITDLCSIYSEIQSKFNKLEGVDSKPELLEELRKVKEAIDRMSVLSQQYDKQMIANNETITESLLTEEKEAYVRRREWSKMHID